MKYFHRIINEIFTQFNGISIFEDILTTISVYLAAFLILSLVNLTTSIALIPAIIYLFYLLKRDLTSSIKNKKLMVVEKAYPALNEKLRTAADNVHKDNPVVDELQREVADDLKKVHSSAFFSIKHTSYKISACILLCFAIVLVSMFNVMLFDFSALITDPPKIIFGGYSNDTGDSDFLSAGQQEPDDIFGEESIAELGDEEVLVAINSMSFELTNVRKQEELPDEDFQERFPSEIDMLMECDATNCVLEDTVPIEQQELVRNYFVKLAEN